MSRASLRSNPRLRGRGRHRSPWNPRRLAPHAWYDAELGQPKYVGYVQLDGTAGDYIWTPDSVDTSFSNDIEVVMRVKVTDWTAASNQTLAGKYVTSTNQRSWRFYVSTTGNIGLTASTNGTAVTSVIVTPTIAFTNNAWIWLRLRLDLTDGANSVGTVETSPDTGSNDEPTSWTANGTNTGTSIASIFDSTSPVEIGSFANGASERLYGQVSRCIVRDGFDGEVITDFDARRCYGSGYYNETLEYGSVGNRYVPFTGRIGDYAYTANTTALQAVTDLDIRVRVTPSSATPSAAGAIVGKWSTGQLSYLLTQESSNNIRLYISNDGSVSSFLGYATSMVGGTTYWLRVTYRQSDNRVQFYVNEDTGSNSVEPTWSVSSTQTASYSIFNGTANLALGNRSDGANNPFKGRIHKATVRYAIDGTILADFDANQTTPFGHVDSYNNGWIIASPKHKGNWTLGLPKIYDRSSNSRSPATFGSGTNQPKYLPWDGTPSVYLPGVTGNYVSCPDAAPLDITGDIEIVARVTVTAWGTGAYQGLVAKFDGPSGSGRSYLLRAHPARRLEFTWYDSATLAVRSVTTDVLTALVDGVTHWVKVEFDADNGAGGCVTRFFLAADQPAEPSSWTLIGDVTTAGVASIGVGSFPLVLGTDSAASRALNGAIHRAIVRNGIGGTTVADFDASQCGQSGYTDILSNVWTVNRSTSGRKTVVQSGAAKSARSLILLGTDDYITAPAAAKPALGSSDASTWLVTYRRWATFGSGSRIFDDRNSTTDTVAGIGLRSGFGTPADMAIGIGNGATNAGGGGPSQFTTGIRDVAGALVEPASIATVRNNGISSTYARTGSGTNTNVLTIGAVGVPNNYIDFEVEAVSLFAQALTPTNIGRLVAYYRGGS